MVFSGRLVSGWRVRGEEWTLIGKKDPQTPQVRRHAACQVKLAVVGGTITRWSAILSGSPGKSQTSPNDYSQPFQMFYPVEDDLTLHEGDTVAARCTMVNDRDRSATQSGQSGEKQGLFFCEPFHMAGFEQFTENILFAMLWKKKTGKMVSLWPRGGRSFAKTFQFHCSIYVNKSGPICNIRKVL